MQGAMELSAGGDVTDLGYQAIVRQNETHRLSAAPAAHQEVLHPEPHHRAGRGVGEVGAYAYVAGAHFRTRTIARLPGREVRE